jgi:hypothetical protein
MTRASFPKQLLPIQRISFSPYCMKTGSFLHYVRAVKDMKEGRSVKFMNHGRNLSLFLDSIVRCPKPCWRTGSCTRYRAFPKEMEWGEEDRIWLCIDYFGFWEGHEPCQKI